MPKRRTRGWCSGRWGRCPSFPALLHSPDIDLKPSSEVSAGHPAVGLEQLRDG
jgi:hypothetical protein